jgi:RNA polymerase primary sigma factor
LGIEVVEASEDDDAPAPAATLENAPDGEDGGNVRGDGHTDDPTRMYFREMGSHALLSREGEVALAKRIEAGRAMMIGGLSQLPTTAEALLRWQADLVSGRMLLRDLIDLEATLGADAVDPEADEAAVPDLAEAAAAGADEAEDGEGPAALSITASEDKARPEVLTILQGIRSVHGHLHELQARRLPTEAPGGRLSVEEEAVYAAGRAELARLIASLHLHANRVAELFEGVRSLNRRLTTAEGRLLRLAETAGVKRDSFLAVYRGVEADGAWLQGAEARPGKGWKVLAIRHGAEAEALRAEIGALAEETGLLLPEFRDIYATVSRGEREMSAAKTEMVNANLRLVVAIAKKYRNRGLQFLDLCDLVGPPSHHPQHRRPGAHHPGAGPHDRDGQQGEPHQPPDDARPRAGANRRGAGRADGHPRRQDQAGAEDCPRAGEPGDPGGGRGGCPSRRLHPGQGCHLARRCGHAVEPSGEHYPGAVQPYRA